MLGSITCTATHGGDPILFGFSFNFAILSGQECNAVTLEEGFAAKRPDLEQTG